MLAEGHLLIEDVPGVGKTMLAVNLGAVLASAGVSWSEVVKTTVFLTDMRDFARMNEVYARAMGDARPARSTVQVSGLPRGVLVEIEVAPPALVRD